MALGRLARQLERRLLAIEGSIDRALPHASRTDRLNRWALQDGYLSQAWQAWGVFCRGLIIQSAQGALTTSNGATGSPYANLTVPELAWIGMKAAKGDSFPVIRPLSAMRHEPTWGDIKNFAQIVQAYKLVNESSVLKVLSAGQVVRHMQTIRNATAHTNADTISEVRQLAKFYIPGPIRMPGDAIFWRDPESSDYVYRTWTTRMVGAANEAVT